MTILSDDERALLEVLAASEEPIDVYDVLRPVMPPRPTSARQGGRSQYSVRWYELWGAWRALGTSGFTRIVGNMDNGLPHLYEITEAGREALAGTKETSPHA